MRNLILKLIILINFFNILILNGYNKNVPLIFSIAFLITYEEVILHFQAFDSMKRCYQHLKKHQISIFSPNSVKIFKKCSPVGKLSNKQLVNISGIYGFWILSFYKVKKSCNLISVWYKNKILNIWTSNAHKNLLSI